MKNYKRRDFIKDSLALASLTILPLDMLSNTKKTMIRTAHIGVGGMGKADLEYISSHKNVEVVALCDVDSDILMTASKSYPKAKTYKDYRILLNEMNSIIDAVIVSTPAVTNFDMDLMWVPYVSPGKATIISDLEGSLLADKVDWICSMSGKLMLVRLMFLVLFLCCVCFLCTCWAYFCYI